MSEIEIVSPNYWDERVLQTQIFCTPDDLLPHLNLVHRVIISQKRADVMRKRMTFENRPLLQCGIVMESISLTKNGVDLSVKTQHALRRYFTIRAIDSDPLT
jgi:hypothetical protein